MKISIFIASLLLVFSFAAGCQISTSEDYSSQNVSKVEPSPTILLSRSSDLSKAYVRAEGWSIPDMSWDESKSFRIKEIGGVRTRRKIQKFKPKAGFFLSLDNPFPDLSIGIESIQLVDATRYNSDGKVFAYRFLYSPQNKGGEQSGSVAYFTYFDVDGNGTFENLNFGDENEQGFAIFSATPRLPRWANE